jgi:trehalose monomycolate/heme transporter
VLTWWGSVVFKARWFMLAGALALVVAAVAWGAGVFDMLSHGGFDDPDSESVRASERIAEEFGSRDVDVVVVYSSETATVDDPAFEGAVTATLDELRRRPEVAGVVGWYDTGAPTFVSQDRRATYAAITLASPDEDGKFDDFEAVEEAFAAPGLTTQVGGLIGFQDTLDEMAERDIMRGEMFALPVVLLLLVFIFRGVVAAAMPLLIGILAILGAFTATRALASATDVSTFALNIIILLGLGMAIDYSLLVVNRYREELDAGHDRWRAVARTMVTAGRTVLVSGLTIALALSSLLIFPQVFLRSMALGGMAAVIVAMLGSLTVLPALLGMLGHRINAWRVPLPRWRRRRSAAGGTTPPGAAGEQGAWARLARSVMRRPVLYLVAVGAVLAVLAAPFLGARFAGVDDRVVPPGTEPRVVGERLAAEFPGGGAASPIDVVVAGASPEQLRRLVSEIGALPDVDEAQVVESQGETSLVTASYPGARTGDAAYDAVRAIRDLSLPAGVEVLVGGRSAADLDRIDSLAERLPWMAVWMASVVMVVLFLAFGSVLLPIKAVVMNVISIAASFGVVIWVFQDGHFADLLNFTPTGFIEPSIPILLLAVLFGLSTDYEVFLLSRIREAWLQTGDNTAAIAIGLQRTGRIITAAAVVLAAVVLGFASGEIVFIKMLGLGMVVAIVVDATLVRALLVPATMRLLGRWCWWVPGPLRRLHGRYGIRESDGADPVPGQEPSLTGR